MERMSWQNSLVWRKMDIRKKNIINSLVNKQKGKSSMELATSIAAAVNQMKKEKLEFSNEEQSLMIEALMADMNAEEKRKASLIINMMK